MKKDKITKQIIKDLKKDYGIKKNKDFVYYLVDFITYSEILDDFVEYLENEKSIKTKY
jgi:hypothetical protein